MRPRLAVAGLLVASWMGMSESALCQGRQPDEPGPCAKDQRVAVGLRGLTHALGLETLKQLRIEFELMGFDVRRRDKASAGIALITVTQIGNQVAIRALLPQLPPAEREHVARLTLDPEVREQWPVEIAALSHELLRSLHSRIRCLENRALPEPLEPSTETREADSPKPATAVAPPTPIPAEKETKDQPRPPPSQPQPTRPSAAQKSIWAIRAAVDQYGSGQRYFGGELAGQWSLPGRFVIEPGLLFLDGQSVTGALGQVDSRAMGVDLGLAWGLVEASSLGVTGGASLSGLWVTGRGDEGRADAVSSSGADGALVARLGLSAWFRLTGPLVASARGGAHLPLAGVRLQEGDQTVGGVSGAGFFARLGAGWQF